MMRQQPPLQGLPVLEVPLMEAFGSVGVRRWFFFWGEGGCWEGYGCCRGYLGCWNYRDAWGYWRCLRLVGGVRVIESVAALKLMGATEGLWLGLWEVTEGA